MSNFDLLKVLGTGGKMTSLWPWAGLVYGRGRGLSMGVGGASFVSVEIII